jgi:hypothetical protein
MPEDDPQPTVSEMGADDRLNVVTPTVPPVQPEKDWKAEAEKWQALSRRNEEQSKSNADAAKRLKEIEDRDLSELQKAQRDAQEAIAERDRIQSEAEQLRASDIRKQVALDKGVPASLVARLQGSTAEELSADADQLLSLLQAPRSPQPDPSQGPRPSTPQSEDDALWAQYKPHVLPNRK